MSASAIIREWACKEGLHPDTLERHQQRIQQWLLKGRDHSIPIIDTCRLDNGGIIALEGLEFDQIPGVQAFPMAALIPAAGASSRYLKDLEAISLAALDRDTKHFVTLMQKHLPQLQKWAIDHRLLEQWSLCLLPSAEQGSVEAAMTSYLRFAQTPKALQMSSQDNLSFIEAKCLQNRSQNRIQKEFFVVPPAFRKRIAEHLKQSPHLASTQNTPPVELLVQGDELSTFRFDEQGELFLDNQGRPSKAPAGHGALLELLPSIHKQNPAIKGLWIQNVDNVFKLDEDSRNSTQKFLDLFARLQSAMAGIRDQLQTSALPKAESLAAELRALFTAPSAIQATKAESAWENLLWLQQSIFHSPWDEQQDPLVQLGRLFQRPLAILGQVQNLHHDVGGTPCWVRLDQQRLKLCLEVPHASGKDRKDFLEHPQKATHFNPVFVAMELCEDLESFRSIQERCWIIAQKTFEGQKVLYHESLLYELLGNSWSCNCMFVEVPRSLFRPHKSIADTSRYAEIKP